MLYDNKGRIAGAAAPEVVAVTYTTANLPHVVNDLHADMDITYTYNEMGLRTGKH